MIEGLFRKARCTVCRLRPVSATAITRAAGWTGGRVAEGARLESVFRCKPNEGSNPSLSAAVPMSEVFISYQGSLGYLLAHFFQSSEIGEPISRCLDWVRGWRLLEVCSCSPRR